MQDEPESGRVAAATHETLLVSVGARIREARKRAGLTQADLAKAVGSGQSYIYQIESGQANITLKTLFHVAVVVGLSPRDLLPKEHPSRTAELLHMAARDFDRFSEQFERLRELILDDQEPPASSAPES